MGQGAGHVVVDGFGTGGSSIQVAGRWDVVTCPTFRHRHGDRDIGLTEANPATPDSELKTCAEIGLAAPFH